MCDFSFRLTDHAERLFQVAAGGFEGVGVDRQRGTVGRGLDGLFEGSGRSGFGGAAITPTPSRPNGSQMLADPAGEGDSAAGRDFHG